MKKILIPLFSVCILVAGMLFVSYAQNPQEEATTIARALTSEQMAAREMTEQVTDYYGENVLAYKNADNTTTIYVFSAPVERVENTITQDSDGNYIGNSDYNFTFLPESISSVNGIEINNAGNFLNIYPADESEYSSKKETTENIFKQERETIIYKDMFGEGIDFYCYLTSFGVNSEIKLNEYTSQNTFQIKIQLPRLVPDTISPDYILMKTALEKGEVKSILYTPIAVDKNGKWCYANAVRLVDKDSSTNTYTVEYTIDETFLKDNTTKYPVTLNQSIYLYKSKQPDTSAYENTGDEAGHYLSPYMLLGDSTEKGEGWTFIRYETLNSLNINSDKIVSAKYYMRNLFDADLETEIGAYAVTADWCSINTRWFNRPTFDENPIDTVTIKSRGDYSLDITPLIKEMISNKGKDNAKYSVRNSFFIRSDSEDSGIILASGDNGLFSPYLEIVISD